MKFFIYLLSAAQLSVPLPCYDDLCPVEVEEQASLSSVFQCTVNAAGLLQLF